MTPAQVTPYGEAIQPQALRCDVDMVLESRPAASALWAEATMKKRSQFNLNDPTRSIDRVGSNFQHIY